MATAKIAGVYMIINNVNHKVYIGSSSNIHNRWKRYYWAAKTDKHYDETKRPITKAIAEYGFNNFTFTILDCSPEMKDKKTRLHREGEFINKYHARDPKKGYNILAASKDTDIPPTQLRKPRKQSAAETLRRCKPIIEYDIKTGSMLFYLRGAKSWADANLTENSSGKTKKDIVSHAVNRGDVICKRYYLFPGDKVNRDRIYNKLKEKWKNTEGKHSRVVTRFENEYKRYKKAYKEVSEAVNDSGWFI